MHRARSSILPLLALLLGAGPAGAAHTRAFVTTTDFSTGGVSVASLATRAVTPDVATVHGDAVLRWHGGRLHVVNRFGQDNVQVLDPAQGYATVLQYSVGNGSNPQDIAFVAPNRAYVSRLGSTSLLVVNPQNGATLGSISLAAFADADGLPEAARMIALADHGVVLVALQRLQSFAPTADSALVAVVDASADTVVDVHPGRPGVQAIVLAAKNPATTFAFDAAAGRVLIGCAGGYGALDGGIEAIAVPDAGALPGSGPTWRSLGVVASEAALGGDVLDVELARSDRAWVIVSDASFDAALRPWNPQTGAIGAPVYAPGGFSLSDCEANDRDELWVCNSGFATPGLVVFHALTGAHLAGPLPTGLPPFSLTFDESENVVADAPADAAPMALGAPRPNPARAAATVALALAAPAPVRLEVLDLAGRRVRTLVDERRPAGALEARWDLRDRAGARVPPGLYLLHGRIGARIETRRLVVMD